MSSTLGTGHQPSKPEVGPLLQAEYRDPFGHMLHVAIACGALFLAPLGIVAAEVGFWILVAVCLIRTPALLPTWWGIWRWPCVPWLVAFVGFALISLTWSSDPAAGAMRFKCLRAALWAVCIWPVIGDPWARTWLVRGVLTGVAVLAATQVASFVGESIALGHWSHSGSGGLHGEESKTALWCAIGLSLALGVAAASSIRLRLRVTSIGLASIAVAGVCVSGSLRLLVASVAALLVAPCLAAVCRMPGASRMAVLCASAAVALATGVWFLPEVRERAQLELQFVVHRANASSEQISELQRRALWWKAEWEGFRTHPLLGEGWGGTPAIVSKSDVIATAVADRPAIADDGNITTPGHPHSLYMMVLGELGASGAVLLLGCIWTVLVMAIRAARENPINLGVLAGLLVWLLAAAGDTVTNSTSVAVGAILIAMMARPSPLPRLTRDELLKRSSGRIRVAVFVERFGFPGGSERFSQQTVELMADTGRYDFHVFANKWTSNRQDIHFYRVPIARFSRTLRPWILAHLASHMIRRGDFDVVHSHGAIVRADVVTVHGAPRRYWISHIKRRRMHPFDLVSDAVDRAVLRNGSDTTFMPVSTLLHDTFRETWGTLPGIWRVLHPGVDCERFGRNETSRAAQRERLGIEAHEVALLFVGMNFEIKGLTLLIESVAHYSRLPGAVSIKVIVVGKGSEDEYRALAKSLAIEHRVIFVGVCQTGIEEYYSAADAFALLSTFETFCMAALEAMAASLPVLVTNRMGIRDLVVDGEHGYVVPIDATAAHVANCLAELASAESRGRMGSNARTVAELHSWQSVAEQLAIRYAAIAKLKHSSRSSLSLMEARALRPGGSPACGGTRCQSSRTHPPAGM